MLNTCAQADKQIHVELPALASDMAGLANFKESWTRSVSDAQGHATTMVCEFLGVRGFNHRKHWVEGFDKATIHVILP